MTGLSAMIGGAATASVAFSTFTASVKGLAIEVGDAFTPALNQASLAIQTVERWVNSWDDTTKRTVGTIGFWGVTVLGVGAALTRISSALGITTAATWALNIAWRASPFWTITGVLTGITAAVGGLAYAFGFLGGKAKDAVGNMKDVNGVHVPGGGGAGQGDRHGVHPDELKEIPEAIRKQIISGTPAQRAKVLDEFIASKRTELQAAQQGQGGALAEEMKRLEKQEKIIADANAVYRKIYLDERYNGVDQNNPSWKQLTKIREEAIAQSVKEGVRLTNVEAMQIGDLPRQKFAGLNTRNTTVGAGQEISSLTALLGRLTGISERLGLSGMAGDGLVKSVRLPYQSRYTSFEQYGESLQLKALEANDKENMNQVRLLELALKELGESGGLLKTIADNTKLLRDFIAIFGH
jgi:hypothetical protein